MKERRKEKDEAERIQRLDELRVREEQRQAGEKAARVRGIKQRIKNEILWFDWVGFSSPQYRSKLIIEIERALTQVDVEGLPENELHVIARGAAKQVKEEAQGESDRVAQELQEKQAKEAVGYADTILKAIRLGAGLPADDHERYGHK